MNLRDRETIEHQLFTWEEWDILEDGIYDFSNITLVAPIGSKQTGGPGHIQNTHDFPKGHKFVHCVLDFTHACVTFYETDDQYSQNKGHRYELHISVGAKMT